MAQRRKSGGSGGPFKTVIWWAVVAMIVLAAWRGIGAEDGGDFIQWFKNLAGQTEETFTDVGKDIKDAIPTSEASAEPSGGASPAVSEPPAQESSPAAE